MGCGRICSRRCTSWGIEEFSFQTTNEAGAKIALDVKVATPEVITMDVAKLREIVDDATFMAIVSASKAAVEKHAGKDVAVRCEVKSAGSPNVSVKPAR